MDKTSIPFLAPPFDMQHTPLAQPPSSTQFTANPSFQPLPTHDRFDSFKSLSLPAPGPSPPSPFFHPLSQPQRFSFSSPPASPHRPFTPSPLAHSESRYSQSTTPASSPHASMISAPVPATSPPSNLLSSPGQSSHNVIDLTSSPSPPSTPLPLQPSLPQQPQYPSAQHTTLESALPKTPVCIGRLDVTALIVYPSAYLDISPSEPSGSEPVWGPVRLQYERSSHNPGSEDTVSIRTPNKRTPHGEIHPGENFAVIERRVASVLGPMLGKGLIRVDSRIRRGSRHVRSMLFPAFPSCKFNLHSFRSFRLRFLYTHPRVTFRSSETSSASRASCLSTPY
jgi:SWI/SNF-related matrix-associated actin-dependent regulator of chromatin subfamily A3